MKKILCSYSTLNFKKSLDLLEKTALEIGKVDQAIMYDREWLETTDFYKKTKYILDKPKGAGYWVWKFPTIFNTLENANEGDIVMYVDAGVKVIDDLDSLFSVAQIKPFSPPVFFKLPVIGVPNHFIKTWTKRDCFVLMNADESKYWNAGMVNAAISLWTKNQATIDFLNEYKKYLRDPRIITDDINLCGKPNFLEFKDHRYDQSVLSIMAVKYNLELYRDPTQWGMAELDKFTNSPYGQLFHHHRNFKH